MLSGNIEDEKNEHIGIGKVELLPLEGCTTRYGSILNLLEKMDKLGGKHNEVMCCDCLPLLLI